MIEIARGPQQSDLLVSRHAEAIEEAADQLMGLLAEHVGVPQRPQPECQLHCGIDVTVIDRVLQGRPAVGVIRAQERSELDRRRVAIELCSAGATSALKYRRCRARASGASPLASSFSAANARTSSSSE